MMDQLTPAQKALRTKQKNQAKRRHELMQARANSTYHRLLAGETARYCSKYPRGYKFADGTIAEDERYLVQTERAIIQDEVLRLSSPEEHAAIRKMHADEREKNRQRRLECYRNRIRCANDEQLNAIIEEIWKCGGNEDISDPMLKDLI